MKKSMHLMYGVLLLVCSELGLYAGLTAQPKNWLDWFSIAFFLAIPIFALVSEIRRCQKWNFQN